jgi:hypothetical protein
MNKPTTYQELFNAVKLGEVKSAKDKDGKVWRFFIATNHGYLCYFKARSSRKGYTFYEHNFDSLVSFQGVKEAVEPDKDKKAYNMIAKFRKMAEKASFTNSFIKQCIALPKTFEQWVADGKKSAYEYSITTGCKITGKVISVESFLQDFPHNRHSMTEAIKNQTIWSSSRNRWRGYDCSISFEYNEVAGWRGFLSMEYKGTGNGYYYLLINDENFIGYDVD